MNYETIDVPVSGGDLRVGIWGGSENSVGEAGSERDDILLIHGVTASHRAFDLLAENLTGARLIAPDLRGRGRSSHVAGASSMTQHAKDMERVLDRLGTDKVTVVGHSMGAFVAVVFANLFSEKVKNLVLVDGGLPLEVPEGLTPDQIIQSVLGPTAERLAMVFETPEDYNKFWLQHPGLGPYWSDFLVDYCKYDLEAVDDDESKGFKAATRYEVARDDTVDLNSGEAIKKALAALGEVSAVRSHFVTSPRGLFDQTPGLFSEERVAQMLPFFKNMTHEEIPDTNHYTIVMGESGAKELAEIIKRVSN